MMTLLDSVVAAIFRRADPVATPERDLLDSIRPAVIPDPDVLRAKLAALHAEIAETERRWEQLDARSGDPRAFLQRQPVAERLQTLRMQAAPMSAQIDVAERRRAAFLQLVRLFEAVAAEVSARTLHLAEHPPQDARERIEQLRALDRDTRVHVRLAARLARISAAPQFREPPDALTVLRDDLEARIRELDRLRTAGLRPLVEWPAAMLSLLAIVEDTEARRKEPA